MLSKSLSTSERFAALVATAGDLAEFCQALYPLLVTHTDDFGRLQGDPFTVKALCFPASPRALGEFASGLGYLHQVDLIVWYLVSGKRYVQIQQFEAHQQGLHKRTRSAFPRVPGISGNDAEVPGQEKGSELKRRELKIPPTPLVGGRLTKREIKHAKEVLSRRFGRCEHTPACPNGDVCATQIAQEIREKRGAA